MSFQMRFIMVLAGTAFLVAFLAGLIGRVPLGYIFLRSLTGAAVFAAIGLAVTYIVQQFLPELLEEQSDSESSVDISVGDDEDDDDLRRSVQRKSDGDATGTGLDVKKADRGAAQITDDDTDDDIDDESRSGSAARFRPGIEADLVEEVQEYRDIDDDSSDPAAAEPRKQGMGFSADDPEDDLDVDELPDMGSMSDAFITTESDSGEENSFTGNTADADGEQAQEMAKAIRTVLQREQQG